MILCAGAVSTPQLLMLSGIGPRAELERHRIPVRVELPGVGRKTANVVLNIAFGHDTCAVDTHIFRVGNRTGLAPGKDVRQVEDVLMAVIPPPYRRPAHHLLILHGRYTCIARKPQCWRCPVIDICRYEPKNVNPS